MLCLLCCVCTAGLYNSRHRWKSNTNLRRATEGRSGGKTVGWNSQNCRSTTSRLVSFGEASGAKKYERVLRKLTIDQSLGRRNNSGSRRIGHSTVDAGLQAGSDGGGTEALLRRACLRRNPVR